MKPSLRLDEGAVGNPTLKSFSLSIISGQLFCGHKPYQSKCLLLLGIASTLCDFEGSGFMGSGHIPHNLISGFILLQKLKPEIKFEALTLERFVTNNTICIQIHETQCIDG